MVMRLIRLRRALMVLLAVGAIAPALLAANQKVNYSGANSWLTGVSGPSASRGLNSQRLPARSGLATSGYGGALRLNPQPLPPRIGNSANISHQR